MDSIQVGTVGVLIGLTVMMVEFERLFQPFVDWLIDDIPKDVTDAISKVLSHQWRWDNVRTDETRVDIARRGGTPLVPPYRPYRSLGLRPRARLS